MVSSTEQSAIKTYSDSEVLMALRRMIKGESYRKVAESLGVSGAYVHDVISKRRGISENLAGSLGFTLIPPPKPQPRQWRKKTEAGK